MHVIIIGAGVIGSCTAYYLSQNDNVEITVIEKTQVACASSGKAGGFLWSEGDGDFSRASFRLHRELAQSLNGKERYGYRAMTTYSVTVSNTAQNNGTNDTVPPWLYQEKVVYCDELGTQKDTAQVHPKLFTQTILDEAIATGKTKVKIGHGVTELIYSSQDPTLVTGVLLDDGTTIDGDRVIICMGPWSGQFALGNKALSSAVHYLPVNATRAHSIVLKVDDDAPIGAHALFTEIKDNDGKMQHPEIYPRPNGTVYICGEQDVSEPLPKSADQVKMDPAAIDTLCHLAKEFSLHLDASQDHLVTQQACYLPNSRDQNPLIGKHPAYKHLYISTGHSVWGILLGPISGLIMTDLLLNTSTNRVPQSCLTVLSSSVRFK
ncbi:FAD dependent oxidoreductase [Hesseltinella vesiculosa]|uniref:FAD dependent oxidoreductase n=1 Tax=Hesseltinella vesiculosa TaxID=101127 RepID=A0A1X2G8X0_9FUNG|nr:FAD dependent oxidoreductase [Hesseltinella vesiculosa]